jgi:hypothetical protein
MMLIPVYKNNEILARADLACLPEGRVLRFVRIIDQKNQISNLVSVWSRIRQVVRNVLNAGNHEVHTPF